MGEQDTIAVARDFIDAFNIHDWERLAARLRPDSFYDEAGTGREAHGSDEIVGLMKGWAEAMPDAKATVTSAIASGDRATLEVTWRGTMTGPFGEFPATGKKQKTPAAICVTVEGDKIKEGHQYFDSMALFKQLGLMPEPTHA
jgi:steroid delta-isomerase-like uncharacterized protein